MRGKSNFTGSHDVRFQYRQLAWKQRPDAARQKYALQENFSTVSDCSRPREQPAGQLQLAETPLHQRPQSHGGKRLFDLTMPSRVAERTRSRRMVIGPSLAGLKGPIGARTTRGDFPPRGRPCGSTYSFRHSTPT